MGVYTYPQIVFPFRVLAFASLFIVTNVALSERQNIIKKSYIDPYHTLVRNNPILPGNLITNLANTPSGQIIPFPAFKSYETQIYGWTICGDILLACLFASIIAGFNTNRACRSFTIGFLHLIGVLLITQMIIQHESKNFLICGIFFGIFLPFFVELWTVLQLFVFKVDFY